MKCVRGFISASDKCEALSINFYNYIILYSFSEVGFVSLS